MDTWDNFAREFVGAYCITCHQPGGAGFAGGSVDFRTYQGVAQHAMQIRCGVCVVQSNSWNCVEKPEQFPVGTGPKPTDDERTQMVEWIDGGMPTM